MSEDIPAAVQKIQATLEAGRFVFGAILTADGITLVEHVDEDRLEDADMVVSSAVTSISSDLVPYVVDHRDEYDDDLTPPASELPRLQSIESLVSAIPAARAYYLVVKTDDNEWQRIKNTVSKYFDPADEIPDPEAGRYLLSAALVDEATDRIASLPSDVAGEDIELVSWSG